MVRGTDLKGVLPVPGHLFTIHIVPWQQLWGRKRSIVFVEGPACLFSSRLQEVDLTLSRWQEVPKDRMNVRYLPRGLDTRGLCWSRYPAPVTSWRYFARRCTLSSNAMLARSIRKTRISLSVAKAVASQHGSKGTCLFNLCFDSLSR